MMDDQQALNSIMQDLAVLHKASRPALSLQETRKKNLPHQKSRMMSESNLNTEEKKESFSSPDQLNWKI